MDGRATRRGSTATTGRAGLRYAQASAAAGRARDTLTGGVAPDRSEPPTVRAHAGLDSGGRAGRPARLARRQPIDRNVHFHPRHGLLEGQLDRDVDVVAPTPAGIPAARGHPRTGPGLAALAIV